MIKNFKKNIINNVNQMTPIDLHIQGLQDFIMDGIGDKDLLE